MPPSATMRRHADFDAAGYHLPPLARRIGPFASRAFAATWWRHRGDGELWLVENGEAFLPLRRTDDEVSFVGDPDVTDYHTPFGTSHDAVAALVTELVASLESGVRVRFDSLPAEAASTMASGVNAAGVTAACRQHEAAAVLSLRGGREGWLERLGKKQRHEVRRKRRRFVDAAGEPSLTEHRGADAVERFAAMHRRSGGDKGAFMTPAMEAFFAGLHQDVGARIHVLHDGDGAAVAAAFGFDAPTGYLLYNSAFEPAAAAASPGIVLVTEMIELIIGEGGDRFDFLKGDEVYKFRLGAVPRPLFEVTGLA